MSLYFIQNTLHFGSSQSLHTIIFLYYHHSFLNIHLGFRVPRFKVLRFRVWNLEFKVYDYWKSIYLG